VGPRRELISGASPVDVSQLLSNVCDEIYEKTPRIRNELITRRSLSLRPQRARRNLIERMLSYHVKRVWGFKGIHQSEACIIVLGQTDCTDRMGKVSGVFHAPGNALDENRYFAGTVCVMRSLVARGPIALDRLFVALGSPLWFCQACTRCYCALLCWPILMRLRSTGTAHFYRSRHSRF